MSPEPNAKYPATAGIQSAAWFAGLYAGCGAEGYGISRAALAERLAAICQKYAAADVAGFTRSLKLEDLALAMGCATGNNVAWEVFLTRFREKLYDGARQITRNDASARELADSIYADLYGTREREGERVSKLGSYTGRGSLEGWLRTVMAQEWVNQYRKTRRMVSLEEEEEQGAQFAAAETELPAESGSVERAVDEALAELSAEERYLLSAYFLDDRTLAQVAKSLGVHESTVSRKVQKLAGGLRKQVMGRLLKQGMSRRQAEEAMEIDVRDLTVDVRSSLARSAPDQGLPAPKRSAVKEKE